MLRARGLAERGTEQLQRLALARPGLGLPLSARWSDLLGVFMHRPFHTPTAEMLTALLGELPPARIRFLQGEIAAAEFCNTASRRVLAERGTLALLDRVGRIEADPLLRRVGAGERVFTVGWHQGPTRGAVLALVRLGLPALVAATRGGNADLEGSPVRFHRMQGELAQARFLVEARDRIDRGSLVHMNVDWWRGEGEPTRFFGRSLRLASGAGWLARQTKARIVPVTRRWRGRSGRIDVEFHEPLPEPDVSREDASAFEAAVRQSIASWFEAWLRENPETFRLTRLKRYAKAPPA